MGKFYPISVPLSTKNKKMYTKLEMSIIFKNCKTIEELYAVTRCFAYLIEKNHMRKSRFLEISANLRLRKIIGA